MLKKSAKGGAVNTFEILLEKEPNDEPHLYLVEMSLQIKPWSWTRYLASS